MTTISPVSLPSEMQLGKLDFSLPPEAKSMNVKIQPSNISSIVSASITPVTTASAVTEAQFPSQTLIFDIPCGIADQFIDTRFTTLNFRCQVDVTAAGSGALSEACLRSNCNSFFDRLSIIAQNGNIVETIEEYGLINDTLINLQMSNSTRDGLALQYGFYNDDSTFQTFSSQGHVFPNLKAGSTAGSETFSYSVPVLSSLVGVLSSKMLNIGRTSKLQLVLQTSNILPFTIVNPGTALTTSPTFKVTLTDFSIQMEYISIGAQALRMLDETLIDNKAYIHGVTYKTSTVTIPSGSTGQQTLLAGVRGSSIKSLFARFQDNSVSLAGGVNGKYDSKNPYLSAVNFNVGGVRYPPVPINTLLHPAQAMRELQCAMGNFNSTEFNSAIIPNRYCVLAASATGAVSSATTSAGTQAWQYQNKGSFAAQQASFIFGENTEVCAKRGVFSGLNAISAPIFLECNIAYAPTYSILAYIHAMMDVVYVHSVDTGDISVRM